MIRSIINNHATLSIAQGLPQPEHDHEVVWLEVNAPTFEESANLQQRFGIETSPKNSSVIEDGHFLYMRSKLLALDASGAPHFGGVTFVLGEQIVAILCDDVHFRPFDVALQRLRRKPADTQNPKAILRVLLQMANDGADAVIDRIADELEKSAEEISAISDGYNSDGKELGVPDLIETMRALNDKEELISLCIEAQLSLARTVRYLSSEVDNTTEADLQGLVNELTADVAGVKEHAYFEHEKVRYLQNAVTNILNIKQNQIVKVFTIITAVFLPPTLVGTFYGMNFAVMPELSWEHGFIYSMGLTLSAAVLPLVYIKRKGWLR
ncbi:magnesium transporter [Pseudomonas sp. NFIX10]|uniref:CorA family divalent cation transporter n=1 Tax=unclassified Pseudomonas TaxID=196821 RepID=UPI0008F1041C|nr:MULTISPECIES: CorA family divalent cation transporter [unclassified Pseudomonas]SFB22300.1 magnesium transporter [Pseudomonas sp. NFIX10]SFF46595.1 magnesium transporter [Pseudomonas sp. NFACC06-1]